MLAAYCLLLSSILYPRFPFLFIPRQLGSHIIQIFYPPLQKTTGVYPWMNAMVGPAVALAKAGASADSAEEMKVITGVNPWRLHELPLRGLAPSSGCGFQYNGLYKRHGGFSNLRCY